MVRRLSMPMTRWTLAVACLMLMVAGCSDGPAQADPEGPQVRDVEPDDSTAAISGVVVDETIRPIAGATVRLVSTEAEVLTAEDGTFVFEGLEAGFYAVEAAADRYLPVQVTVDVQAGVVATPRIMMPRDTSPVPFHQSHQFNGHMVFSDFYGIYILTGALGNNALCECVFEFTGDPDPKTLVLESVWESSTPRAEDHEIYWEVWSPDSDVSAQWSASPTLWHVPGSNFPDATKWLVQASSNVQPDVEQEFEGFLTFFYVEPAPPGWSLVDGDA